MLHAGGHQGHAQYAGGMPFGLQFSDNILGVSNLLGPLERQGIEKASGCPWQRFERDGVFIHVKYNLDEKGVDMFTLMTPDMADGRPKS